MIVIDTLTKKPQYINQAGHKAVDLTAGVWQFANPVTIGNTVVVAEDMQMRVDLVARAAYGDANKIDYVTKLNGISNPFSIYAGQIIAIGELQEMGSNLGDPYTVTDEKEQTDIRATLFDPTQLSQKDNTRLAYIQAKAKAAGQTQTTPLPPNFADVGTSEITVQNGQVLFGGNVVTSAANCPVPLSVAAVKARLLQNAIFKPNNK